LKPSKPKKTAAQLKAQQAQAEQLQRDETRVAAKEAAQRKRKMGMESLLGSGGELGTGGPQPAATSKLGTY